MAIAPTQVRIDAEVKKAANELFSNLGMDMSGAINMFLHQCILRGGLPFEVSMPNYSNKTLEAMAEAKRISKDTNINGYNNMVDLKAALED